MCLGTVTKTHDKPSARSRWAWKAFDRDGSRLLFPFYGRYVAPWKRGEWITAHANTLMSSRVPFQTSYAAGFHVFTRRVDAINWHGAATVVRVRVRRVRTEGTQLGMRVLVADELMVPARKRAAK